MPTPDIPETSDLGALVDLLTGAGYVREETDLPDTPDKVFYVEHSDTEKPLNDLPYPPDPPLGSFRWVLNLAEGVGYMGFAVRFYFTEDGTLVTHGVWE
jgi:hypothetical protein